MDYDDFDRRVMDQAVKRAYALDDRLPNTFARLLDRIADCDRSVTMGRGQERQAN